MLYNTPLRSVGRTVIGYEQAMRAREGRVFLCRTPVSSGSNDGGVESRKVNWLFNFGRRERSKKADGALWLRSWPPDAGISNDTTWFLMRCPSSTIVAASGCRWQPFSVFIRVVESCSEEKREVYISIASSSHTMRCNARGRTLAQTMKPYSPRGASDGRTEIQNPEHESEYTFQIFIYEFICFLCDRWRSVCRAAVSGTVDVR